MNTIHYFSNSNGMHFAAVAPGMYSESICFYDEGSYAASRIDFNKGTHYTTLYYEVIENNYSPCSRQTYLTARRQAFSLIADFFGEFETFQTPPVPANWRELDPELMQGFLVQVNK